MKKVVLGILGLGLVSGLFAGNSIVPANEHLKINTSDILWQYNFLEKKCFRPTFEERKNIINNVKSGGIQITEKYMNDAGTTYQFNFEYMGQEYRILLMDTYGECKFYHDLVVEELKVDSKDYKNLIGEE